jgi:splicing factor 45
MSSGFQNASLAMSSASAADSLEATIVERPVPFMRAETGEDVYLRRLALSQRGPPPAPPKVTIAQPPPNKDEDVYQQPAASLGQPTPLPPLHTQQGPREPSDLPEPNSVGTQPPQPTLPSISSAPSAFNVTADFEERVRHSRNAVAAIAARFSALAPAGEGGDSSQPVPAPEESAHEPPKRCA